MRPGKYIVFEGINGCGKGAQISLFEDFLYDSSKDIFTSRIRAPNKLDENGVKARKMLDSEGNPLENSLEATKYFGENHLTTAKHIACLINLGHNVIGDRNYISTFAFQQAQGISYKNIAKAVDGSRIPDLTFLIDIPVGVAFKRLVKRDGENRRKFDSDENFLGKVRKNYLGLPNYLSKVMGDKNIVIINGNRPIEAVQKEINEVYRFAFKF